jgi:hypothetical protein
MLISSEPSVFTTILTISGVIRELSGISTGLVAPYKGRIRISKSLSPKKT